MVLLGLVATLFFLVLMVTHRIIGRSLGALDRSIEDAGASS